ncbi:hypothetical protein [Hyphomonas sp.]|uniref:hypothetical protein n=1 Tax=Hyphomonas sp. TaxID=87 RepID=UPI003527CE86
MSLLHPPPGFPALLVPIWPLIWVQVLLLRAQMRAKYGKGVQYHWSVTPCGRVWLTSIDWIPGQAAPAWLAPAHPNARIAAALDGRWATAKPLLLGEKGVGMRGRGVAAGIALWDTSRPLAPTLARANAMRSPSLASPRRRGLPLPET